MKWDQWTRQLLKYHEPSIGVASASDLGWLESLVEIIQSDSIELLMELRMEGVKRPSLQMTTDF